MKYASETIVPVEKTRAEIESTCMRYGASSFSSGWDNRENAAAVLFQMKGRTLKFILPLPDKSDKRFTHGRVGHSSVIRPFPSERAAKNWEQACRQKWRALLLAIKAKLEAVESQISTFDSEFMSHIVLPDGYTIGERMLPKIAEALEGKELPPLLMLPAPAN